MLQWRACGTEPCWLKRCWHHNSWMSTNYSVLIYKNSQVSLEVRSWVLHKLIYGLSIQQITYPQFIFQNKNERTKNLFCVLYMEVHMSSADTCAPEQQVAWSSASVQMPCPVLAHLLTLSYSYALMVVLFIFNIWIDKWKKIKERNTVRGEIQWKLSCLCNNFVLRVCLKDKLLGIIKRTHTILFSLSLA